MVSLPIGGAYTNWSLPLDALRKSLPDQAKIGEPAAYASTLSVKFMVAVVPSACIHVWVTLSGIAPAKFAGDVIDKALRSLVCAVQVPSSRSVPPLSVHPDGTSAIVAVTRVPSSADDGAARPRLIGSPATPAGAMRFRGFAVRKSPA